MYILMQKSYMPRIRNLTEEKQRLRCRQVVTGMIEDTQRGNTTYKKEEDCFLKRSRLNPWLEAEL